ncbi:MAG TPA: FlgD immunoglobulin-like domain containing protein [Candidatus Acidoferrales bacterium]|nr:FlgD immunoglobulin-like domain containing protein [Candidatus Acidoferrales bacterium]
MGRPPCLACAGVLAALLLALCVAKPALAAWPHDNINGGVPLQTLALSVGFPVSVPDGTGGAIIAWVDYRTGAADVYAQRLNAYGVPQWTTNGIAICTAGGTQDEISIAADGAGGAVLAWEDLRAGASDIYAQRVSSTGAVQWTANGVPLCQATGNQTLPALVPDGSGGAVVAWTDARLGSTNTDIYAQHVSAAGAVTWTTDGVVVCNATGLQSNVAGITNGAGGGIFTWQDQRSGNYDIYAQMLNNAGVAQWTANGVVVCNATSDQTNPSICTDDASGALISWSDQRNGNFDIYSQRMWYPGIPVWIANGVATNTQTGTQEYPLLASDNLGGAYVIYLDQRSGYSGISTQRINQNGSPQWGATGVGLDGSGGGASPPYYNVIPDGVGGAIAIWQDARTGQSATYVQRLSSAGAIAWGTNGLGVDINPNQNNENSVCSDGAGGAIVSVVDLRNEPTTSFDLFGFRVDAFGVMGGEPVPAGVKDVPNDQGGSVKVSWNASPLDLDPASYAVASYLLFRSAPPNVAAEAVRAGRVTRSLADFAGATPGRAPLYAPPDGAQTYYWELIDQQAAYHLPSYSLVTTTTGDSTSLGNPRTAYMVQARNASGSQWWNAAPDSGYSVDNLAPIAPAPFTGQYAAGTATLHWNPNAEADLAGYRLYRGTSASFTPGPGDEVAALTDTGYTDVAGTPYVYKLSAVDVHGNESPFATLVPSGTTGVGDDAPPRALALAPPSPSPAHEATLLRFDLPHAASVRLELFDPTGRRMRAIDQGERAAGRYAVALSLRDDAGRPLAAGLYLVRLSAEGRTLTRRLVALR